MKFITTALFAGTLAVIGGKAHAAPSDLDLGFKLIHSAEFAAYSKSDEAKGLTLTGLEWKGEGGNEKGELVEYKLKFVKRGPGKSGKGAFHSCEHGASAYFTLNTDGTRVFAGADISNYDSKCN
jgi:hypothetical protein